MSRCQTTVRGAAHFQGAGKAQPHHAFSTRGNSARSAGVSISGLCPGTSTSSTAVLRRNPPGPASPWRRATSGQSPDPAGPDGRARGDGRHSGAHRIRAGGPPPAHDLGDHVAPDRGLVAEQDRAAAPVAGAVDASPFEPGAETQRQSLAGPFRHHDNGARLRPRRLPRPGMAHRRGRRRGGYRRARSPRRVEHVRQARRGPGAAPQLVAAEPRGPASGEDDRENRGDGGHASKGNRVVACTPRPAAY